MVMTNHAVDHSRNILYLGHKRGWWKFQVTGLAPDCGRKKIGYRGRVPVVKLILGYDEVRVP